MFCFIYGEICAHSLAPPDGLLAHLQTRPQLAVAGHDYAYVVAKDRQGWWQGTQHISHAPHLHHWGTFGSCEKYAHLIRVLNTS